MSYNKETHHRISLDLEKEDHLFLKKEGDAEDRSVNYKAMQVFRIGMKAYKNRGKK